MWDPEVPLESRPSPKWLALWARNWPRALHTPKFILKDTKIHLESDPSAHHRCSHISSRDPLIPTLVRVACVTLTLETFTI